MSTAPPGPPRWKFAVMVWLAIFPALTLILWLAGARLQSWPLPLRTLATTAVLVPVMVYVLLPAMQNLLAPWMRPSQERFDDPRDPSDNDGAPG